MTEQDAREQVMLAIANGFQNIGLNAQVVSLESTALDAYRAAVRAETLREVRGVVEGMPNLMDAVEPKQWLDRDAVLSRLDALDQTPEAK